MSEDTIKRSDAVKAVFQKPAIHGSDGSWYHADDIKDALKNVPSADRPQGDSVSRQYLLAEIDDLADEFSEVDENGLHSERWCGIVDAKCVIANAPLVADRPQGACLKEAEVLLKATRNLLNKQNESIYVLNMLAETVTYYGVECDGSCLIEDIDAWLELYGSEEGADDE